MTNRRAARARGTFHSSDPFRSPSPPGPPWRPSRLAGIPPPDARVRLRQALALRDEWLSAGLSAQPADKATAEAAVAGLYDLLGRPAPAFEWAASPAAALRAVRSRPASFPRLPVQAASAPGLERDWPAAARLASRTAALCRRLAARAGQRDGHWWRDQRALTATAGDALESGVPLGDVIEAAVHESLRATLQDAICRPLLTALRRAARGWAGPAWYGQHDAYWAGYYDVLRRTGLASYRPRDDRELDLWSALARSAGWWWPGEGVCVMAGRPTAVHTEPQPAGRHGELRLHSAAGPAIRFADGERLYVMHGAPVPPWVITDPSIERIRREPNVEVRRCAIERLGWDAYIRGAGLSLVATAADPGNPGHDLCLYDVPAQAWGYHVRILLAVNGSPEPDGQHRRYGLSVPPGLGDPVAAAGWTYGLSAGQYATLARRT